MSTGAVAVRPDAVDGAPSASLRVARLMAVSLGIAGLILLGLDLDAVGQQWSHLAPWWSIGAVTGIAGASVAVTVFGALGSARATTASFAVLAAVLLVAAATAWIAGEPGTFERAPWVLDLAVIGAAAAGAGLPVAAAIPYLAVLLGLLGLDIGLLVRASIHDVQLLHVLQNVFYTALFMALAFASRRAGRMLDVAVRSAVAEVSAAAEAEARRAQRRRTEGLIHDTVIVALLAFGRGDRSQDERAAREAARALAAIEELEAPAPPAVDPTPRDLAWRLQAVTTELEPEIRFVYTAAESGIIPTDVAAALAEAMSEALRNSLRHAGPRALRQVSVEAAETAVRVVVLDDGAGFAPSSIDGTRLGIREGIVHRMATAGGSARVLARPGRGTTVVLEWSAS